MTNDDEVDGHEAELRVKAESGLLSVNAETSECYSPTARCGFDDLTAFEPRHSAAKEMFSEDMGSIPEDPSGA